MSITTAARLARRDLRGGLRGFRIFLACVILGVAAIAAVGTVRESIATGLEREGATLLGGDAEIEFSYRFADTTERDWMETTANRVSELVDFRSMAVAPDGERGLTQIKAVDGAYPLLGQVTLDPEMPLEQAFARQDGLPGLVMHPLMSGQLGVQPGDTVRLGDADFVLSAEIMSEPDNSASGFGLGPRTIVQTADLEGAGLLGPGTLYSTHYRMDLPTGADLAALKSEA